MNNKIIFIHSLNNYSGSPNVLSVIIKGFVAQGYPVELITSRGVGLLSNIKGVHYRYTCYRWFNSQWKTAFLLVMSQFQVFFKVMFSRNRNTIYYLNTITPVGAAWACRLSNKNFIYHVHENMGQNKPIYRLFRWTYKHCNQRSIFVSHYLKTTALNCKEGIVIHNGLDANFAIKAQNYISEKKDEKKNILMVSSLRRFKGVYEFADLARRNPHLQFELVLAATDDDVSQFANEAKITANLLVFSAKNDMHPFYRRAKLLLQLSHPSACIETFGLTILEAMHYGVPAIVPNVGGPTELVEHGINGYLGDPLDLNDVNSKIQQLMQDSALYDSFSKNALSKSKQFGEENMLDGIEHYLLKNQLKN